MKSTRWMITYIVMASVGLWLAFFMSLKFMTPGHTQNTPPPPGQAQNMPAPSSGDLPPEFAQEAQAPAGNGQIPPPPTQPPIPEPGAPPSAPPQQPPSVPPVATPPTATPPMVPATMPSGNTPPAAPEGAAPVIPQFASDEQYTYDPTGRRDPFKPYRVFRPSPQASGGGSTTGSSVSKPVDATDPLQKWDLDRFSVVAIMWEIRHPKAMVKDPDGKMFMVSKSTKIGRNSGQVVAIREGEVVVVETIDNEGVQTKEVKILELKK